MADLPRTPITRQEEYLSRLAGENTTLPREPITREEMYLEGAIARVEAVEEEVEEIKSNPDVVDVVGTYQDLQDYDTSTLTDKDIIRVLEDNTHSNNSTYYRWDASASEFEFVGEIAGGGTNEPKTLSSDDFNYPVNNPSRIALWLLPTGEYIIPNGITAIYNNGGWSLDGPGDKYASISNMGGKVIAEIFYTSTENGSYGHYIVTDSFGTQAGGPNDGFLMRALNVLNSHDTRAPLSADQGRVLNEKISKTPLYIDIADLPTPGNTATGKSMYTDFSLTVKSNGQYLHNILNSAATKGGDHTWQLVIVDTTTPTPHLSNSLFVTTVRKASPNASVPSSTNKAEAVFTYFDGTTFRYLRVWAEGTGGDDFCFALT